MCGIYFSCNQHGNQEPLQSMQDRLRCRGPDASRIMKFTISEETISEKWHITAMSTVLSLRGDGLVTQPITSGENLDVACSFLMWNGEAWKYDGEIVTSHDSGLIYQKLVEATRLHSHESLQHSKEASISSISDVMSRISGPYAFVFFDSLLNLLFFGRDVLGRRSLLIRKSELGTLELASESAGLDGFDEVDADGLYYIDLSPRRDEKVEAPARDDPHCTRTTHIPWLKECPTDTSSPCLRYPFPVLNTAMPALEQALHSEAPEVDTVICLLKDALRLRLSSAPANLLTKPENRVAVLFSGGIDCTLLARIAHDVLPQGQPIDLLNVAFENPRVVNAASKGTSGHDTCHLAYESCPDRITGRASHAELVRTCPDRLWQFIPINVPFEELTAHRQTVIELLRPHDTEMDFSIGCALSFAARGQGYISKDIEEASESYVTPAQVLISGLGADELFGGYSRHAVAYQRRGRQGLVDELRLDFERISQRNLGRDDRIISHWGKEVRYPFLDEDVVSWALSLPTSKKCGFEQNIDESTGLDASKRLLRYAAWKLGIRQAAQQKKRAIQFGARTAKMTIGKTKGTQKIQEAS